jgi:hypothetical protein
VSAYNLHVLVPSRGRPDSIMRLWRSIVTTAEKPWLITLCVRLDDDDPTADAYPETHGDALTYSRGPRIRLAASWNEQAAQAVEDGATHLALWGDDNIPITLGWDEKLIGRLDRDGPGFVYGRDGIWDHTFDTTIKGQLVLPTAVVMPVEVYRVLGWVSPPGLTHLCVDVAWRDLGIACGALFYEPRVTIRHLHRIAGAPDDQTYRDANDDPAQVRADNIAVQAWRLSPDFDRARVALAQLREEWPKEGA